MVKTNHQTKFVIKEKWITLKFRVKLIILIGINPKIKPSEKSQKIQKNLK